MFKPDIPFARDDANRFLPWMVGLMSAVAALMMLVGLTLGQWSAFQHGDLSNRMTIHLPHMDDGQDAAAKQVLATLSKTPGIRSVKALSDAETRALVAPWLGSGDALSALPMPSVFDVIVSDAEGKKALDVAALQAQLEKISPDVSIDTHAAWVEKFARISSAIQFALFTLAGMMVAALAGMMATTARAAMKLHESTVFLLHAIGASDGYIAKQFQQNALMLALRGALPGTLFAAATYAALGAYGAHLDAPLLPSLSLSVSHWLMLILLPVSCGMIAVVAVRMATLSRLKQLP